MRTIQAKVPNPLASQVEEFSEPEKITVDQLVGIPLANQVSAWR